MSRPLTHKAFVEGFPYGVVAIARQGNGKYRIIVSRPPNNPDATLADAEQYLVELVEAHDFFRVKKKKPWEVDEEEEDEDED